MKVNNIIQTVQSQQIQKKTGTAESAPDSKPNDKVEISTEARDLQKSSDLAAKASLELKNTPDVREDRVREVKEKIDEGFFERNSVKSVLVDKLFKEFGL